MNESRDDKRRGRIAPHHLKLKVEWGKHSETAPEVTKRLEQEVLAAAIDHINDNRYRTLAPVSIETEVDIFTKGIAVDPNYGEFEEELQREDLERKLGKDALKNKPRHGEKLSVTYSVHISTPELSKDVQLEFAPGGRRVNVGRATDNDLHLNHVKRFQDSCVAANGQSRHDSWSPIPARPTARTSTANESPTVKHAPLNEGDLVAFGDVEVRFRRINPDTWRAYCFFYNQPLRRLQTLRKNFRPG